MDFPMPNISGIEAIIAIRGEFNDARIVVLTTYAGPPLVVRWSGWKRRPLSRLNGQNFRYTEGVPGCPAGEHAVFQHEEAEHCAAVTDRFRLKSRYRCRNTE